jgi:hypothetical protein
MSKTTKKRKPVKISRSFNVRIYDMGNGEWALGYVMRFKKTPKSMEFAGRWVRGNREDLIKLLMKGQIVKLPEDMK